jgi:hypothetical protein
MTPEGIVKNKISILLKAYAPSVWYFMPTTRGMGRSGVADYCGTANGLSFLIEAKSADGRLTVLQRDELARAAAAGVHTFVVSDDTSLEHLHEWVRTATGVRHEVRLPVQRAKRRAPPKV